jgi:predicted choloylglycine hydrolase
MRKILFLVAIITMFLLPNGSASGCTVFNCNLGNKVLAGNNEDGNYLTDVEVWSVARSANGYGRICFGWKQLLFFRQAQGGMNDQGLFFDWASCPKSDPPRFSFKKRIAWFSLSEKLLAECATVDEAIAWLKQYNILFIRSHIMLADKKGNSAIVEWVDGEIKILRGKNNCQMITNFWLSHPELGNYPCLRYNKVMEMLGNQREISVEYFQSILELVSKYEQTKDGNESGTIYSNVYDLSSGDVYVYYKRDFENPIKINLEAELKKGNHNYKLKSLFGK